MRISLVILAIIAEIVMVSGFGWWLIGRKHNEQDNNN